MFSTLNSCFVRCEERVLQSGTSPLWFMLHVLPFWRASLPWLDSRQSFCSTGHTTHRSRKWMKLCLCESSSKKRCQLCLLKWIQCRIAFDKVLQCEEGFTRHVCCQRFGIIALVLRIHCTVKLLLHWTCARYWYKFEKVFKHANAHVCDDAVCVL